MRCTGNLHRAKYTYEWAFRHASLGPWHHARKHNDGTHVDQRQHHKRDPRRFCDFLRRARFAGSHSDKFHTSERINRKCNCQHWCEHAAWEESALGRVLCGDMSRSEQSRSKHHEGRYGHDLDHGKPELEATVAADIPEIDQQKEDRKYDYPD